MEVTIDREVIRKVIMDLPATSKTRMNYLANRSMNQWWAKRHPLNYTPSISASVGFKR